MNNYHGTHALRERARKLKTEGILIIRFEMPYNIWCDGCKAHIAMGVRYNAEKTKVGKYFTTPIHKFRMKCHLCDQHFEIQTDPKNLDYVILSGARRKEQRWDMGENEQIVTEEKSDIKRLQVDSMFNLEHQVNDKSKIVKLMPTLRELEETKSEWKDDYKLNSLMRNVLRGEKKEAAEQKAKDKELLDKWNINIDLVKENENDVKLASLYKYNSLNFDDNNDNDERGRNEKRKNIEAESIFDLNDKKVKKAEEINKGKSLSLVKSPSKMRSKNLEEQKNGLKNKLSKSIKSQILSKTGFCLDNPLETLNPISNSKEGNCLLNIKNSIVKKHVANEQKHIPCSYSDNRNEELMGKSTFVTKGLVSNDYGESSSSENSPS